MDRIIKVNRPYFEKAIRYNNIKFRTPLLKLNGVKFEELIKIQLNRREEK